MTAILVPTPRGGSGRLALALFAATAVVGPACTDAGSDANGAAGASGSASTAASPLGGFTGAGANSSGSGGAAK